MTITDLRRQAQESLLITRAELLDAQAKVKRLKSEVKRLQRVVDLLGASPVPNIPVKVPTSTKPPGIQVVGEPPQAEHGKYVCAKCGKRYLWPGQLNSHYRIAPDHKQATQ